jgi:hypothetical protein
LNSKGFSLGYNSLKFRNHTFAANDLIYCLLSRDCKTVHYLSYRSGNRLGLLLKQASKIATASQGFFDLIKKGLSQCALFNNRITLSSIFLKKILLRF